MSDVARPAPSRGSLREAAADPAVRVAVGVTMVTMLGFGLIVPVLPLYARSFGVGPAEVGLLNTTFALARLAFDLVAGPLADRFGERRMATFGSVVVGVSSVLAAVAPSFGLLVLFRALGGAGSSILFAALMSYLIHSVPPNRMARTMSFFFASFLLGTGLGQPIGGLIAEAFGLASPLWFYAAACFISAGLTLRFLSDAVRPAHEHPPAGTPAEVLATAEGPVAAAWGRARALLRIPGFATALAANAVLFWVLGSVRLTLVPLFARDEVGLSEAGIGLVLGAAAAGQLAVMWRGGTTADVRGRKAALVPGLAGLVGVVAILGLATEPWSLALTLAALGVASGFAGVVPAAIVADVAPKRSSGAAVGLFRFAGDVGFVLGPAITGLVADLGGFAMAFAAAAVPIVFVLAAAIRMPETLRRTAERTAG
ncbi:MAG TPA: MFS transporter [Actinomycetota bacterium]|nr:MFS transporter [Actinomycetota bacterium]